MSAHKFRFRVEMSAGQDMREVLADSWVEHAGWLIFYRKPPTGGQVEYWRASRDLVISLEIAQL